MQLQHGINRYVKQIQYQQPIHLFVTVVGTISTYVYVVHEVKLFRNQLHIYNIL